MNLVELGSQTARNGFKNEYEICEKFNNWQNDFEAKLWLEIMQYEIDEIEYVKAVKIKGSYKADINVQVQIKLKNAIDIENIQVKLVSNKKGFNQIDKRKIERYNELWNFPDDVKKILQYYTGELLPYREDTKDKRRMFLNEMTDEEQNKIIKWFTDNKMLILTDMIRGRGQFCAEWILVAQKLSENARWALKNVNEVLQHYSQGSVYISDRGTLKIGNVTVQRKGGDNGRESAKMLQFKLDPTEMFETSF